METVTEQAWWQKVATGVRAQLAIQRRTSVDLAAVLGRGTNYVSLCINGKKPFKLDEIEKAAAWFGVSVESLAKEQG